MADLYDMIHPNADDTLTVRSVFIIGPDKKVKLTLTYPASTGRNVDEIIRVLDSLQLTADYSVATPGQLDRRRRCHHRPGGQRRRRQGPVPQGMEGSEAVPAGDAPAQPLSNASVARDARANRALVPALVAGTAASGLLGGRAPRRHSAGSKMAPRGQGGTGVERGVDADG